MLPHALSQRQALHPYSGRRNVVVVRSATATTGGTISLKNPNITVKKGTVSSKDGTSTEGTRSLRSGTNSTRDGTNSTRVGTFSTRDGTMSSRTGTRSTRTQILRKAPRVIASPEVLEAEASIKEALANVKGRGASGLSEEQLTTVEDAVGLLEQNGGTPEPTLSPLLDGTWRLLYTSRPGTSSPIQRTFTAVDAFRVFQEVELGEQFDEPRVTNVVEFGDFGVLRVEALASTDSRPLQDFTPRQEEGLALFGKSSIYPPAKGDMRIDFQFDNAYFKFPFLPFTLPYPVPFRLLGDECKGWIDVTYLSADGAFRLSRGNKGTLFILTRDVPASSRLMLAIRDGGDDQVQQIIEEMAAANPTPAPAQSELAQGKWRLVWSQQADSASALQKWGSKQSESFQLIGEEGVQNVAELLSFLKVKAFATTTAESETRTGVSFAGGELELGPFKIPLPGIKGQEGWIDWLYLDEEVRITRGNKGSLFVHIREDDEEGELGGLVEEEVEEK